MILYFFIKFAFEITAISVPTDIPTFKTIKTPVNSCRNQCLNALIIGIKLMVNILMTLKAMIINLSVIN